MSQSGPIVDKASLSQVYSTAYVNQSNGAILLCFFDDLYIRTLTTSRVLVPTGEAIVVRFLVTSRSRYQSKLAKRRLK